MPKQELINLIEQKRFELIQVANKSGFNSAVTIKYSQDLDRLLNEYNRTFIKNIPTHFVEH